MKRNEVSDEERRHIQLYMLDEIDAFCSSHQLKWSLAFGTAIGAIRHKGFIPWDDDVDIIMPLPDLVKFKKLFRSDKLNYHDIDNTTGYDYAFSRISYNKTYSKCCLLCDTYGVNIDLYPVVGLPDTHEEIMQFFDSTRPLLEKRLFSVRWKNRAIRYLPIKTIPFHKRYVKKYRDVLCYTYDYGKSHYYLHAGRMVWDNVFDFDVFENMVNVEFEGHQYPITSQYDRYLSHCYGDYMALPPEDQRHPYHGGHYYWK